MKNIRIKSLRNMSGTIKLSIGRNKWITNLLRKRQIWKLILIEKWTRQSKRKGNFWACRLKRDLKSTFTRRTFSMWMIWKDKAKTREHQTETCSKTQNSISLTDLWRKYYSLTKIEISLTVNLNTKKRWKMPTSTDNVTSLRKKLAMSRNWI